MLNRFCQTLRNDGQSFCWIPRTRYRVRLIGVPTERPFPSVLGEPFEVTTTLYLGQALSLLQQPTAEQRIWACSSRPAIPRGVRDRGWKGAPRLFAFPSIILAIRPTFPGPSGLGVRQANLPII